MSGGAEGEVYADVSEAGGDGEAVRLDMRGGGEESEEGKAEDGPECFQSLPGRCEAHPPADEDGRAQVEGAVKLEVNVAWVEEAVSGPNAEPKGVMAARA